MDEIKIKRSSHQKTTSKNSGTTSQNHQPDKSTYLDKIAHTWLSHFVGWTSPSSFSTAYCDWLIHLSYSPEKQIEIYQTALQGYQQFFQYAMQICQKKECELCVRIRKSDHRFQNQQWDQFPYNLYSQYFLLKEHVWDKATKNTPGVSKHHEKIVNFSTRQLLDMIAPSNFPLMNPEVIDATITQSGMNFINGYQNWVEDITRIINKQPPVGTEAFIVGKNIAATPGKIIYRNHLIELIQYQPTTTEVYAEPILIVPAWIMKYYILDLTSNHSMVKYLVDHGHSVFMISWKNPSSEDRNLELDDYINLGIFDAMNVINHIISKQKIHSVGYCIGGTLLMLAAAAMAKNNDERLKSITLFAAQIDFKDAGELLVFIDESQINHLEDIMWEKGYLDGAQMAGTFSMLRSVDLVWSKIVIDYQLGKRKPINDLMAWDFDGTRLPYKMHSQYLRKLFLNNDLIEGHYKLDDKILSLQDITLPIFSVSTTKDHVAPWKSVYKIHFFTNTDVTFVLTKGGHNSGVVNEPGHPGSSYQIMEHDKNDKRIGPEYWQKIAPEKEGSWWPAWQQWLVQHSGKKNLPPTLGSPKHGYKILCDAPGTYVLEK